MSTARIGSASHNNANRSRRAGVSSCGAPQERQQSWSRPFRRTRRAIDRSLQLIEASCRVVEAAERLAARHPLRAGRKYGRVSGWLDEASMQLSYAARGLNVAADRIAQSPGDAPKLLLLATARWIDAATKLTVLSNRLGDTFDLIRDATECGTTLDLSELFTHPTGIAPRVIRLRPVPERRLSCGNGCNRILHERRRRAARLTFADAARRIFRGRAPPLVSTCPL